MTSPSGPTWFAADRDLEWQVTLALQERMGEVEVALDDGVLEARGIFDVWCESDVLDRFDVEISFPKDYPNVFPRVRETAGRIPEKDFRHVNTDRTLCLELPERLWQIVGDPRNMRVFLEEPLNGFLQQQLVYEAEGRFISEWPHGVGGRLAFYFALIPEAEGDPRVLKACLELVRASRLDGRGFCPLCRRSRVNRCHRPLFDRLRNELRRELVSDVCAMLAAKKSR